MLASGIIGTKYSAWNKNPCYHPCQYRALYVWRLHDIECWAYLIKSPTSMSSAPPNRQREKRGMLVFSYA